MKQNRFNLWGLILSIVLLAAVPFVASAQAQTGASAAPNGANPAPEDPESAVVTIEARFNG